MASNAKHGDDVGGHGSELKEASSEAALRELPKAGHQETQRGVLNCPVASSTELESSRQPALGCRQGRRSSLANHHWSSSGQALHIETVRALTMSQNSRRAIGRRAARYDSRVRPTCEADRYSCCITRLGFMARARSAGPSIASTDADSTMTAVALATCFLRAFIRMISSTRAASRRAGLDTPTA